MNQFYIGPGWDKQSFFSECVAFTGSGKDLHDDQIDAVSGCSWLLSAHGYKPYEFKTDNPFALKIE
jgi:predicted AlkP superfamily pyrophosphatase or phosphodiesterase